MKPKLRRRLRDINIERAYAWGFAARGADKSVTKCPNLLAVYGETYGTQLADAWMRGWMDAEKKLGMKGAD